MLSRQTKRIEKTAECSRLQTSVQSVIDLRNKIIAQTQKLTRDYEDGLVSYDDYSKRYDRLAKLYNKHERLVSEHKQRIKQIQREKRRPVVIASVIIALVLIGLLSIFGRDLITGLAAYGPLQQYQAMDSTKVWNGTFDTTGANVTGIWQVYANAVANWFYTTSIDDRNFTLNTKPLKVILYWPDNNTAIIDRYTNFTWYNATDAENDSLTYHLLVDETSDFSSAQMFVNVSNIAETGPTLTNYTPDKEFALSTIYYWKVRAYDSNVYGEFSDVWNFSITPLHAINLIVSNVSFGSMINGSNTTEDNSPPPILVENVGNIPVNLTFNGSALWTSVAAPTDYYMFKAGVNESGSFNETLSNTTWTQIPLISTIPHIFDLKYVDTNDTVEIELNLTVPSTEGAGAKSSDILVRALS